ncbi:MAG: 4-hydroxythreonine-4-phosphate dehydrogenase PdxA [Bacteroidales bacterium]|nr:4-hydroxythreonine-4-phosphate dehydrogenase PdxA [Bacteroidales bacterium]MCF8343037.1 4-hydroxythreonine-4-phosphate dehydrogenase PdxA [Bacteroidales bacterium]MCF8350277.1 4-hydroxythreonine-4-phosphate dehydrogenase PdxA [Bacteroidales bacterium]MCF8376009.1 4-hydroxythreonine-4-phosphate dehydrogenase PdxA [Bacteroidales bacterium]MCF8402149.1 4-hydroxythreonine-4-phosphate dehydrogenase PdxA [Bacteroidales bacterium]
MVGQKNESNDIKVAITHGDVNGIGYEIIIKALQDNRLSELFTPVLYGLSKAVSYHRKTIDQKDFNFNIIKSPDKASYKKPNIINVFDREVKIDLGQPSEIAGEMAYRALEVAVQDLKRQQVDVLVTAPINKFSIQSSSFDFPGHTEYLAERFDSRDHLMLMVSDQIRIGVVTGHIPVKDIAGVLNEELVYNKINILHQSLKTDFSIRKPRIAVLSLNPHAGDEGLIGEEDRDVVEPAIRKAFDRDILVYGPYSSDGFFGSASYKEFDAVLAMYHDQGMLPFKLLSFESGVNYTAGLPIVRTSPAHGTAFDIAGKNMASPDSFRKALYLAVDIYRNRQMNEELVKNPLQSPPEPETKNNGSERH